MKAAFAHNQLKAALLFAAKNDVRYYLNGVLFRGETGELVATDGHRCIVIETGWRAEGDVIIPRELIEKVLKVTKAEDTAIEMSLDESSRKMALGGIVDFKIDGKYPDYSAIFVQEDGCVPSPAILNTSYIVDAAKARALIAGLSSFKNTGLAFCAKAPNEAGIGYLETVAILRNHTAFYFGNGLKIAIQPLRV
jgi:DNA polymerase-3 subunit beta